MRFTLRFNSYDIPNYAVALNSTNDSEAKFKIQQDPPHIPPLVSNLKL